MLIRAVRRTLLSLVGGEPWVQDPLRQMKVTIGIASAKLALRESGGAGAIIRPVDSRLRGDDVIFVRAESRKRIALYA